MLIGYELLREDSRPSAVEQLKTEAVEKLHQAGCQRIYLDFQKGTNTQLQSAFSDLKAGDILVVLRFDSLGDSKLSFLQNLNLLRVKGVHLQSLEENFLLPSNSMKTQDLIKTLFPFVEPRKKSGSSPTLPITHQQPKIQKKPKTKKGKKMGRPIAMPEEKRELIRLLRACNQDITITEICKLVNISRPTYHKYFPKRQSS